ncbi:MAG: hypothetical protein AABZ14_04305, partial [Candidatus Margulisiibacteriota bacterium]
MRVLYFLLWPIMVVISLFGGLIIGLMGITIGHFQDMVLDIRREYIEYTKYYALKKRKHQEALLRHTNVSFFEIEMEDPKPLPMPIALVLKVYLDIMLYPFVVLRYIYIAPWRLYCALNKCMKR